MISQDKIIKARSKNLFELLSQRGYSLTKEGDQYRVAGFSGLIIKDSIWFHHSENIGGNAIDLLMHLEKLTFIKAINSIDQDFNHVDFYEFDKDVSIAENYLIHQRNIDCALVYDLMALNIVKQAYQNKVCFIGYNNQSNLDDFGQIKCISWRGTNENKRGEIGGSDKSYSFSIPDYAKTEKRHLIIAEGPIDILSIACLENHRYNAGYYQTYKIALCGTSHKKLLDRITQLKPAKISLILDNDPAGKHATKKIYKELSAFYPTKIITYPKKDPNEFLQSLKK